MIYYFFKSKKYRYILYIRYYKKVLEKIINDNMINIINDNMINIYLII